MSVINNKKGLSPVVATVLLISLALILALIIFLWAKSFIGEKTIKFDKPIEEACTSVDFEAEAYSSDGHLNLVNRGNVPLYGLEIRKTGAGSISKVGTFGGRTIDVGENGDISLAELNGVSAGDKLLVVPMIIGEQGDQKRVYTCESNYGKEIEVI